MNKIEILDCCLLGFDTVKFETTRPTEILVTT